MENDNSIVDSIVSIDVTLINSSVWEMTNAIFYLDFDEANKIAKDYDRQSYYESILKQYILKNSYNYPSDQDAKLWKNNKQF